MNDGGPLSFQKDITYENLFTSLEPFIRSFFSFKKEAESPLYAGQQLELWAFTNARRVLFSKRSLLIGTVGKSESHVVCQFRETLWKRDGQVEGRKKRYQESLLRSWAQEETVPETWWKAIHTVGTTCVKDRRTGEKMQVRKMPEVWNWVVTDGQTWAEHRARRTLGNGKLWRLSSQEVKMRESDLHFRKSTSKQC